MQTIFLIFSNVLQNHLGRKQERDKKRGKGKGRKGERERVRWRERQRGIERERKKRETIQFGIGKKQGTRSNFYFLSDYLNLNRVMVVVTERSKKYEITLACKKIGFSDDLVVCKEEVTIREIDISVIVLRFLTFIIDWMA